jgi:signal transduction histidine kinase
MRAAGADPKGGGVQAFLERRYRAMGVHYLTGVLLVGAAVSFLLGWVAMLLISRTLDLTHVEYTRTLIVGFGGTGLGLVLGIALSVLWGRPLLHWLRADPRPTPPPGLWEWVVAAPRRVILTIGGCGLLVSLLPTAAYVAHTAALGPWEVVAVSGLAIAGLGYVQVLGYFVGEAALRPLVRDIAERMDAKASPPSAGLAITRKAFIGLLAFGFLSAIFSTSLVADRGAGADFVGKSLGASLLVAITFSLAIATVLSEVVLGPFKDLLSGTRQVAAGDLSARLPVLSDDEFGQLAQSFNEMVAEVQASKARIVATADEERRRMERDLHDGAQQHLVLLKMKLAMLRDKLRDDPDTADALADEVQDDLARALAELRDLAHGIYPAILEHEGLPAALRDAVDRAPIEARLESNQTRRYKPELEAAVYFCCLEALQNAGKHASDSRVTVRLSEADGAVRFEVADDGPGFDLASRNGSVGLQNMTDRIGALGGSLSIDSRLGNGTTVSGSVPVEA